MLAVSGQNVAYVVAGVLLTCWLLGIPRLVAQAAALIAIVCYVAAVGWQPSVVRAGIAGGLASLAWLAARPRDRWYFMLLGAFVLLAWSPYNLFDPGFQLSFAAVAAIFVAVPGSSGSSTDIPLPRALAAVLALSTACAVATAPILWVQFGSIPVLSVLANGMGEPAVAPILGLGLAASAVGSVLPDAALALAWANGWVAAYLAWCARLVGGLPFSQVSSGTAVAAIGAALCVLVLLIRGAASAPGTRDRDRCLRRDPGDRLARVGAFVCPPAAGGASRLVPRRRPGRRGARPGARGSGTRRRGPAGGSRRGAAPAARRSASHGARPHPSAERPHRRSGRRRQNELRSGAILDPGLAAESPYHDDVLRAARDRGVRVVVARAGQRFRIGRLALRVLWPADAGTPGTDPNDRALVLLASFGSVDLLLTADAESNVTGALPLGPVEIVKVAHHGSADAGLPALLDRLRPRLAVISVGSDNDYGHPTRETLAALRRPRLRLLRTDEHGTVTVTSDGRWLEVTTAR